MTDQRYTFYWLDGRREVLSGDTPEAALNRAGYGAGALRALDFYAEGDDSAYIWQTEQRRWWRKDIAVQV